MPGTKSHSGSCHCKRVRFEVTADFAEASVCNCSICSRVGWKMGSVPRADFKLLAGEDAQADYQFGGKAMHHLFCKTCGIHAFGTYGTGDDEKVIVNLSCIDELDIDALAVKKWDGKSL